MAYETPAEKLARMEQRVAEMEAEKARDRAPVRKGVPDAAPHVTTGPVGQDSARFSLSNYLANCVYGANPAQGKFERGVMERFNKALRETGSVIVGANPNSAWFPISFDHLGDAFNEHADAKYVKAVVGNRGQYDPDEADWLVKKGVVYRKAQSAYVDATGGTLVAPPVMGEVIPLIRPQAAFLAAGAQTVGLPPQGRYVRPRITSASVAQALGEAESTPDTTVGTDQMELQAKKIACSAKISEEATAYTSGTLDAMVQADMARTLGLKMDAFAFYGAGTTTQPAGLTSAVYSSAVIDFATTYSTAAGIGANGNDLLPEYGDQIPTLVEERSFGLDGADGAWVMRPAALSRARSQRADAATPGDEAGPFVDILRKFGDAYPDQYAGRKVVKTTNLKNNLTKGSATDLSDVFYGIWSYGVVGTYGAVQFAQGHDGNTFLNGQYILRGTLFGDVGFLYPSAFAWYTKVKGAAGLIR